MSVGHLEFLPVTADEYQADCDGRNGDDGPQCRQRPTHKDLRDNALYCAAHAAAVDRHGADGRYAKVDR